ncbi:MAG: ATP-binding cassette domain-containing protein [Acidobacteriota bacterium]|nr:ATP-binding cassette domain-containing protein [Acidobacteriota bacterium]
MTKHRFFAPEVVQTSGMDCGPASLKCLLKGFGIPVSYGRLREACQTEVDGTSIDTMETVAGQLGLEVEQIMLPADHLLLFPRKTLPAIVVTRLPSGLTHFVVAWRTHGGFLQVMDPATGRRWIHPDRFSKELYIHTMAVPAAAWSEFARGEEFQSAIRHRMGALGIGRDPIDRLAVEPGGWENLAALDAGMRFCDSLVRSGGLRRGREAARILDRIRRDDRLIPERYWSARPGPNSEDGELQVLMRGAVLVRVVGKKACADENLGPELTAALREAPARPARELCRLMLAGGNFAPAAVVPALAAASAGVIVEAVLFRGLFDLARELALPGQRIAAIVAIILFSTALLSLDIPIFSSVLRLGRQLENRLRIAFLDKIPRLGDRYFQSRLTSDMAERSHATQRLRHMPDLGRRLLRSVFELCATAAAIVWLDPSVLPIVLLAVAAALLPSLIAQPVLAERDLRVRSHAAALTRFCLDALLGLIAIRAHGAERGVRRQHDSLLTEWAHAAFGLQTAVVTVEAVQTLAMFGLAAWLLLGHLSNGGDAGRVLLMAYWAINLPVIGQDIGVLARQYPYYRNLTLRLIEPLGAPERDPAPPRTVNSTLPGSPGIAFRGVSVEAGGHTILEDIDFDIEPGTHLGIVGPSGAGKSSLVGVLLGWLQPKCGEVLIDGEPLDTESLRRRTAWVDPAVQLWNRAMFENLCYGAEGESLPVGRAIDAAMLRGVLETLPDGLQTPLGEGGALLSGGEGQRVRLGRAVLRPDSKLVILDEPFRGLDRQRRRELLARARDYWRGCTLLCITHDVDETRAFDRVLVIERGRIVENGAPGDLAKSRDSRYSQLLDAEVDVRRGMWSNASWRRVRVGSGTLVEEEAAVGVERI